MADNPIARTIANIRKSGIPGQPITIRAEQPGSVHFEVTYNPSDIDPKTGSLLSRVDGLSFNPGVQHVVVEGIELSGMQIGVNVGPDCSDVALQKLDIHDLGASETYFIDGDASQAGWPNYHTGIATHSTSRRVTVRQCKVHDLGLFTSKRWGGCCVSAEAPKCTNGAALAKMQGNFHRSHGMYLQGFGHLVDGCSVWNIHQGFQVKLDGNRLLAGMPDVALQGLAAAGQVDPALLPSLVGQPSHRITNSCFGPDANPHPHVGGGVAITVNPCTYADPGNGGRLAQTLLNPPKNVRLCDNLFLWRGAGTSFPCPIQLKLIASTSTGSAADAGSPGLTLVGNQFSSPLWVAVQRTQCDDELPGPCAPGRLWAQSVGGGAQYTADPWLWRVQQVLGGVTAQLAASGKGGALGGHGAASLTWFHHSGQHGNYLWLNGARLAAVQAAVGAVQAQLGVQLPALSMTMVGNYRVAEVPTRAPRWTIANGCLPPPFHVARQRHEALLGRREGPGQRGVTGTAATVRGGRLGDGLAPTAPAVGGLPRPTLPAGSCGCLLASSNY